MTMTAVTPLVAYAESGYSTTTASFATIYESGHANTEGYESYTYEFCTKSETLIDALGTYTQVKVTGYLVAGKKYLATPEAQPFISNIQILYVDDMGELIYGVDSTAEYGTDYGISNWQSKTINGTQVLVFPYCNFTFRVPHYNNGIPQINGNKKFSINAKYALTGPTKVDKGIDFAMIYTDGFMTKPCMARITGCGSFYNQTSLDEGTATSFTLNVYKTTDIYSEIFTADGQTITAQQYIGFSTDGITADIIPFEEVSCEASRVTLTITTEIQDWLLQWCNKSKSQPIYYILKTVYYGYTRYDIAQRYFYVGNAEPTVSFSYIDYYNTTAALTGDRTAWIKNASKLSYTFGAYAQKHATITNQYIKCGTFHSTQRGSGELIEPDGDYIEIGCTDSRGFTASQIITPTALYDYFKPTATIHCSNMTGDGAVQLSFSGRFKNVTFASKANTLKLEFRYKKSSDADYGDWITVDGITAASVDSSGNYSCKVILEDLDYQATYYYQSRITDLINSVSSAEIAGVSIPLFDWSETDFNFNIPVTIQGAHAERIYLQGTEGIWTYIFWSSGVCECWGTYTGNVELSNSEGALYYSNDIIIDYPTDYSTFDNVLISGGGDGASWVRTTDGTTNGKVAFKLVGAASGSTSISVPIHAWGVWR
jgi:hypothetical protein